MNALPDIFYSNGVFLVYKEESAVELRRRRIVGQLIGCAPKNPHQIVTSGLPYLISNYAAYIVYLNKFANFKELKLKSVDTLEQRAKQCSKRLSQFQDEARREFEERQLRELEKRNIKLSPSRLKQFDDKKLRLSLQTELDESCSSYEALPVNLSDLFLITDHKMTVFKNLYDRGFYVSSGMKYGSDFLVYEGDPVRYHARYAVRVVANNDDKVDLTRVNYSEINALLRLCHTAKKICLLAIVCHSPEDVKYWTLKDREYLSPTASVTKLDLVDPRLDPV